MSDIVLAKLRRARVGCMPSSRKLEPLIEGCRAALANLEPGVQVITPELLVQPRRYKRDTVSARGEISRMVLDVLREAGKRLSVREIALAMLRAKRGSRYRMLRYGGGQGRR